MNFDEFVAFIGRQSFRKATTAVRNPHEYIYKGKNVNGTTEELIEAARFIRENGFTVMFWGKPYTCFALGKRLYWTMDANVEDTTIINRNNLRNYTVTVSPKEGDR